MEERVCEMTTHEKIRQYIQDNLVIFDNNLIEFSDDDNIFEKGFVNSLFSMQLVTLIENEFNITIESEDLEIDNFSTVNNILKLIEKKSWTQQL